MSARRGRVVHFEIPYDDPDRARAFYADAFGWTADVLPDLDYTVVATGPGDQTGPTEPGYINGGMAPRGAPLAGTAVVVEVDDIEAALARVEELGGRTVLPRTAVGKIGWSAYVTDTEGNVVGSGSRPRRRGRRGTLLPAGPLSPATPSLRPRPRSSGAAAPRCA